MKKIKKICFDKCEATVLSERVFTILPDGRVVKLVFITKFEGEDPSSSPSPIFCSRNKIYLIHNEDIRFINDSLLNFVLWHEVGHIYHYDCYRLSCGDDAVMLGLTDYFGGENICLIEWAENVSDVLPENIKTVKIEKTGENGRKIVL